MQRCWTEKKHYIRHLNICRYRTYCIASHFTNFFVLMTRLILYYRGLRHRLPVNPKIAVLQYLSPFLPFYDELVSVNDRMKIVHIDTVHITSLETFQNGDQSLELNTAWIRMFVSQPFMPALFLFFSRFKKG
jgi:hypothetical protein